MLKGCEFNLTYEEMIHEARDIHNTQIKILAEIESSKYEMNP